MPAESKAQLRWAHAVAQGDVKSSSSTRSFARELVSKMHGKSAKSLPEKKSSKGTTKGKGD